MMTTVCNTFKGRTQGYAAQIREMDPQLQAPDVSRRHDTVNKGTTVHEPADVDATSHSTGTLHTIEESKGTTVQEPAVVDATSHPMGTLHNIEESKGRHRA